MPMHTVDFRHMPPKQYDVVLDVGCGEGRHTIGAYAAGEVKAIGLDLSAADLATASTRAREFEGDGTDERAVLFTRGDAEHLPFADHSIDKVICSEVLEHIDGYHRVLAELVRVLKPFGTLAVSVPRYGPERVCWALSRAYHQEEGGHVRIFNAAELSEEIESYGLLRFRKHHAHALHVPYWWLRCLFWRAGENMVLTRWYHRLLVWDLMSGPWLTRLLETCLRPLIGKSVVMYFVKPAPGTGQ